MSTPKLFLTVSARFLDGWRRLVRARRIIQSRGLSHKIETPALGPTELASIMKLPSGQPLRLIRLFKKWHPCLFWSTPTFFIIARCTTGHHIAPLVLPSLTDRNHVVYRQLTRRKTLTTILTNVLVSQKKICARKLYDHTAIRRDITPQP